LSKYEIHSFGSGIVRCERKQVRKENRGCKGEKEKE